MHLGDFAAIMLHAFFAKLTRNMFNVGGDKPYSLIDVAELVREVINPRLDIIIENKPSRIGNAEISRYICDPSPILNEVGIHPTSLEKSVKTMLI